MRHPCTTQKTIRSMFWNDHPDLTRVPRFTQNDYPTDTRLAFCDFVEMLARSGVISDALAKRATLQ